MKFEGHLVNIVDDLELLWEPKAWTAFVTQWHHEVQMFAGFARVCWSADVWEWFWNKANNIRINNKYYFVYIGL